MAKDTVIVCDRCGKTVEGLHEYPPVVGTSGWYDTRSPGYWAQYANPGEAKICDDCMWSDPRYQAVYGDQRIGRSGGKAEGD